MKTFLKYLIGGALALFLLHDGLTSAADLGRMPVKEPVPNAVVYDAFSGLYLGLNAGYGWDLNGVDVAAIVPFASLSSAPQGFVGGLQVGYGQRFGNFFYAGIEGDVDGAAVNGTANFPGLITANSKNTWLASIRGRFGIIPVGHAMIYGTVGYGFGGGSFTINELFSRASTSVAPNLNGLVWGGGIEVPLGPPGANWLGRLEYLQYDFGTMSINSPSTAGLIYTTKDRVDVVRAGVSYVFSSR